MKSFFLQTYFFWVFTRIIFIAGVIIDLFIVFPRALNGVDMLIDFATLGYIGLMIYNTVIELQNKTRYRAAKYIVGIISILIAVLILIVAMLYDDGYLFLALIFVTWVALLGIFDLLIMNRREEELEISE
jgi:phosphoglycerol transferase MdoB-like AlkP superfamily enzyme